MDVKEHPTMATARGRLNEITRAALEGAGVSADGGFIPDAGAGVVAIHTGVPALSLSIWARNRAEDMHEAMLDELDAAAKRDEEDYDIGPLFSGLLMQAFLMGWLVRDEQEKRG